MARTKVNRELTPELEAILIDLDEKESVKHDGHVITLMSRTPWYSAGEEDQMDLHYRLDKAEFLYIKKRRLVKNEHGHEHIEHFVENKMIAITRTRTKKEKNMTTL